MSTPALKAKMAKRMQKEIENSRNCTNPYIWYAPVSDDNLEWHFTIRGPEKSPFEGGIYHGKIVLPSNFPFSAPDFYFLTENGRYTINKKICLSISGYHNESWQPAITIETMVQMIQVFMEDYTNARIGISFIETSEAVRRELAKKSVDYCCPKCGKVASLMRPLFSLCCKPLLCQSVIAVPHCNRFMITSSPHKWMLLVLLHITTQNARLQPFIAIN